MTNTATGSERTVPGQQPPAGERNPLLARLVRPVVTHWQFSLVVAAAIVMRLVVVLGYPPIFWFSDSYNYLQDATTHVPDQVRANGYPFLLDLLLPLHSLTAIGLLQAAMGVVVGVTIYALLRRRGLPWWGAALPTLPVLFDAYELHLEHMITADPLFIFLVTIAVVILCWSDRPSVLAMAIAGLLIGYATLVRSVGEPLLVVFLVAMLARRVGLAPPADPRADRARAHRRVHALVPRHLRSVRADRILGQLPVQPGQHVCPVLQDERARRLRLPVRSDQTGEPPGRGGVHLGGQRGAALAHNRDRYYTPMYHAHGSDTSLRFTPDVNALAQQFAGAPSNPSRRTTRGR